jgi:hypothetical protein
MTSLAITLSLCQMPTLFAQRRLAYSHSAGSLPLDTYTPSATSYNLPAHERIESLQKCDLDALVYYNGHYVSLETNEDEADLILRTLPVA